MSELIGAIHSETMAGRMPWGRSAENGKFQSRIGDYVIQLHSALPYASPTSVTPDYLTIAVTKIDGTSVEMVGGMGNALMTGRPSLSPQDKAKLKDIFVKINTTNQDIEQLIKLLKSKD
ncbi:hypothetical protein [Brevundimonas sp. Root1423]|uniref:hypothetical protein n=1 Tax=Brevundimonas sp. Root1423 TaxID=1736462 RepID=UPI0012E3B60F|nr:hypothetical protein [Brevundimonas sp. Root1423]